jgi:imidazolonepropionase-like amidohydrolase
LVVDLRGLAVYPGFIDAGSALGLVEVESIAGSVDSAEIGTLEPDLIAASAVNAHSELVPVARAGGVTACGVFFGGPTLAGQASVIRLAGASTGEMVHLQRAALHVVLPAIDPAQKEDPAEVKALVDLFRRARARAGAALEGGAQPAQPEPQLEALEPYLAGRLPVVFTANREASIRFAVGLAERLGVRAVIRGGVEAWKVKDLLVEKKVPVIVGPVHALPGPTDPYDAPYACAGELAGAGVPIAFQSSEPSLVRNLPILAGTAVAFGLPHETAVHALTLGAARILGVDRELGTIEPGKLGDLVVTDGDPLEAATHVVYVFIAGEPVSLESRHTRLYERFKDRREVPARRDRAF